MSKDSDWYKKFIKNSIGTRGFWVIPGGMLSSRFEKLKTKHGWNKFVYLFTILLVSIVEIPLFVIANRKMKSMKAVGFW